MSESGICFPIDICRVHESIYRVMVDIDEHSSRLYRSLAGILSLDELGPKDRKDLAFTLHFDMEIESVVVCQLLGGDGDPVREWLESEGLSRQIRAYKEMPYDSYLATSHWKVKRERAVTRDGYRCRVCNSPDRLNVHHRTYERIGEEVDSDLITLCQPCHQLFHDNGKLCLKPEG